ncbi:MAG: non-heme iron oxygenase ferredoxin subunit [Anaerolineae bacterium]|jgi:3-phenylpropionate/trans-cinnamate dioxygenase ferredoxin subunit|nr:non-heme iron oxygenase ferredoxin subunit [Anaerolineae bacterium]
MKAFITVCPATDIPEGQRAVFSIKDRWIAIFCVSGRYYAIEDVCTHDGNTLTEDLKGNEMPLEGYEIACSRHGARFDIRTGKVMKAPALIDVPWFETRLEDGYIEVAI